MKFSNFTPFDGDAYLAALHRHWPDLSQHELLVFASSGFIYNGSHSISQSAFVYTGSRTIFRKGTLLLWSPLSQRWNKVSFLAFRRRFPWFTQRHREQFSFLERFDVIPDFVTNQLVPLPTDAAAQHKMPWHTHHPLPYYTHVLPPPVRRLPVASQSNQVDPKRYTYSMHYARDFARCYFDVRPFQRKQIVNSLDRLLYEMLFAFNEHTRGVFTGPMQGQNVTSVLYAPDCDHAVASIPNLDIFCRLWGFSYAISDQWDNFDPGRVHMIELLIPH